ncbi:hypothetical protein H9W95_07860 [Flavobacterium lindanitolerans]|nr:hypothetical protein [Flavobacterium lindanitolerans]
MDVIDFLSQNKEGNETEDMLNLKLKILKNDFGLKPTDDFSMIRILNS